MLALLLLLSTTFVGSSLANHADSVSGVFESDDGNLAVDHTDSDAVDWNSFTDAALAAEWNFERFEDRTGNPDDIFSGGVKQDHDCASTREGSLGGGNSKFDLSDIYLSHKTIDDEVFLFLAWVRVPSSPSSSSHIAYEFNKGTLGNCPDSDLLRRVEQDMLIVYDFEGGDADSEVKMARWLTAAGDHTAAQCDTAKALPCWGDVQLLTGLGFADAKVNNPTDVGTVFDAHRNEDLAPVRFGEAGINLTAAGVFPRASEADSCESFGHVLGVSRSSGNSGTAQMKDKVGPHEFELTNCGRIVVEKVDEGGDRLAGAEFTLTPGQTTNTTTAPSSLMVEIEDGLFCLDDLLIGHEYTVSETGVPDGFEGAPDQTFTVTEAGTCTGVNGDTDPDLTFVNVQLTGSIVVVKLDHEGELLADAGFTITPGDIAMDEYADGVFCTDGLLFGDYTVTETTVPPGFTGSGPVDVTVDEASTCDDRIDDGLPVGDPDATFANFPQAGRIEILKTDDAGNPLQGVRFQLFADDTTGKPTGDALDECTTGADGTCEIENVDPGFYCVVEDASTLPAGYEPDPGGPQCFEVEITEGGDSIELTFENPRLHKVIVIVCHEGTNTLHASTVTDEDGTEVTTLAEGSADEALLCGLDGFTGKQHGEEDYTVDIADH